MVAARVAFLKSINFEAKAATQTCGTAKCTPEQVLIVASIAEGEVQGPDDGQRVAEAVYLRLKEGAALRRGLDGVDLHRAPSARQGPDRGAGQGREQPVLDVCARRPAADAGLRPVGRHDQVRAVAGTDSNYYWCVTRRERRSSRRASRARSGTPVRSAELGTRPVPPCRRPGLADRAQSLPGPAPHRVRAARPRLDLRPVEVPSRRCADCPGFADPAWGGLSLTMPLKRAVIPLLDER